MVTNSTANGARRRSTRTSSQVKHNSTSTSTNKSHKRKDLNTDSPNVIPSTPTKKNNNSEPNTPITKNANAPAFELVDENETVKSSEKPPEHTYNTPIKTNANAPAFELVDENETVKSSEKPPEHTYTSKLVDGINTNPLQMSTFLLHKMNYDKKSSQSDVDTVGFDNSTPTTEFSNSIHMTMMFKLPSKKKGRSDDNAPKLKNPTTQEYQIGSRNLHNIHSSHFQLHLQPLLSKSNVFQKKSY